KDRREAGRKMARTKRHIVALGGGGFSTEPVSDLLDTYALRLTNKKTQRQLRRHNGVPARLERNLRGHPALPGADDSLRRNDMLMTPRAMGRMWPCIALVCCGACSEPWLIPYTMHTPGLRDSAFKLSTAEW